MTFFHTKKCMLFIAKNYDEGGIVEKQKLPNKNHQEMEINIGPTCIKMSIFEKSDGI